MVLHFLETRTNELPRSVLLVEKGRERVCSRHFVKNCPRATLYLGVPASIRLHMTLPFVTAEARYKSKIYHPTCIFFVQCI